MTTIGLTVIPHSTCSVILIFSPTPQLNFNFNTFLLPSRLVLPTLLSHLSYPFFYFYKFLCLLLAFPFQPRLFSLNGSAPLLVDHQDDSVADAGMSPQADQRNRLDPASERLHPTELRRRPRKVLARMRNAQPVAPGHEGSWQGQCDRARSAVSVLWTAGTLGSEVSCG